MIYLLYKIFNIPLDMTFDKSDANNFFSLSPGRPILLCENIFNILLYKKDGKNFYPVIMTFM